MFAIGQTAAVSVAASDGLGQHIRTLDQSQISGILKVRSVLSLVPLFDIKSCSEVLKAQYAAHLLYIPSLCFAKLALLSVLYRVSPVKWDKRLISGVGLFIIIWAAVAVVVEAFQCQVPQAWNYLDQKCINRVSCPVSDLRAWLRKAD